jgi:hypothetical protein
VKSLAILRLSTVDLRYAHRFQCFQDPSTDEPNFPGLHTLVLFKIRFPPIGPIAFYRGMPNVRRLTLVDTSLVVVDEGPLWPHLQMLSIANRISFLQLRDLLAKRLAIGLPIAHIRLWELAMYANHLKLGLGVKTVECVDRFDMMSDSPLDLEPFRYWTY